jgi:hypothetical protein
MVIVRSGCGAKTVRRAGPVNRRVRGRRQEQVPQLADEGHPRVGAQARVPEGGHYEFVDGAPTARA